MKEELFQHILDGCRNNDRGSQKALYDHYYGYGLSVAMLYCRQKTESREILNDAFLKVFASINHFDSNLPFTAWFRTIVVRTAINHFKKHVNDIVWVDLDTETDMIAADDFLSNISADELLSLLQKLPPAYRLTLNLYALEGYTHLEVAEMLGISVGTSKSNLSRARAKLKDMMSKKMISRN